jgi:DNA repair exonuclease SbcCD nuclease subunit
VLGADLHLREDCPACRTDGPESYWAEQEAAVYTIRSLCEKHGCPFLCAGDVFNVTKETPRNFSKPSANLIRWAAENLPETFAIFGQHDLIAHSLENWEHTGLALLGGFPNITIVMGETLYHAPGGALQGFSYGIEMLPADIGQAPDYEPEDTRHVAMAHQLVWQGKPPFPGAPTDGEATRLLRKFPGYDLILTGDNHQPFVVRYRPAPVPHSDNGVTLSPDRLLVNPGSMMRMKADQANHEPRVYLWDAEANEVEPVYLPITLGVISREHIEKEEARDERITAFVERLADDGEEADLDYKENMRRALAREKPHKRTEELVWQAMTS